MLKNAKMSSCCRVRRGNGKGKRYSYECEALSKAHYLSQHKCSGFYSKCNENLFYETYCLGLTFRHKTFPLYSISSSVKQTSKTKTNKQTNIFLPSIHPFNSHFWLLTCQAPFLTSNKNIKINKTELPLSRYIS